MSRNQWITGVETIKRQTRAAYDWLGCRSVCGCRLSLWPIGCMPALSVPWTAPLQLRYQGEWVEFNAPLDTIQVISEGKEYQACGAMLFAFALQHSKGGWKIGCKNLPLECGICTCVWSHAYFDRCLILSSIATLSCRRPERTWKCCSTTSGNCTNFTVSWHAAFSASCHICQHLH